MKCPSCGNMKFTKSNPNLWCDRCGQQFVEIPEKSKTIHLVMELDEQRHAVFEPVCSFLSKEKAEDYANNKNVESNKDRYHVETLVIEDWRVI